MSIWTHVVGCIRVDGIPGISPICDSGVLQGILGEIRDYDWDGDESIPTKLPGGSEGTLQYRTIEYGEGLTWMVVAIWGDLRDYSNVDEIERWWNEVIRDLEHNIRDAVLTVKVEGQGSKTFTYKQDEDNV
jgi:hypothetical protein